MLATSAGVDQWSQERLSQEFHCAFVYGGVPYRMEVTTDFVEIHERSVWCANPFNVPNSEPRYDLVGKHQLNGCEFQVGKRAFLIRERGEDFYLFQIRPGLKCIGELDPADKDGLTYLETHSFTDYYFRLINKKDGD